MDERDLNNPPPVGELVSSYQKGFSFARQRETPRPGLYEDRQGGQWVVQPEGKISLIGGGSTAGGFAKITTDKNGQATIVFPEPLATSPRSLVVTAVNSIILAGVLELDNSHVTIFVWDVFTNAYWADKEVSLYWIAVL